MAPQSSLSSSSVLVINCGSSSIKLDMIDIESGARAKRGGQELSARAERIGSPECRVRWAGGEAAYPNASSEKILEEIIPRLIEGVPLLAVGHRVAHGGASFGAAAPIDPQVIQRIEELIPLAPLHNPHNLSGIRVAKRLLPELSHVAVFDTAFHSTLPTRSKEYALPEAIRKEQGLRRYGFHGTSHRWVAERAAEFLREDIRDLRIITCHLGNGASVCAIESGRSIDTSMGMTPLEGLVMGSRSGDLDPGILLQLLRAGYTAEQLDRLLNNESGLSGLSGVGNDLRDIEERAANGDENCRLAIQIFTHRLRKYLGAYAAVLGGVDAIVFTGGIGENSALIRHRCLQRLEFLGARLDEEKNRDAKLSAQNPCLSIGEENSRTKLLVIATDEARAIASEAALVAREAHQVEAQWKIPVAVSARHVHLTQSAVEALFGPGHQLTHYKDLSQPGQFACQEAVTVVGPKGQLSRVRVLGPTRSKNQVEISRTDEFTIGVDAPIRDSGDTENTPGVTLVGPHASLTLQSGLICARRHIHMTPEDARRFGVKDRDVVEVAIDSAGRDLVFGDVLIRVSDQFRLEMHIDTDEGNAAEVVGGMSGAMLPDDTTFQEGALIPTQATARLRRKDAHYA